MFLIDHVSQVEEHINNMETGRQDISILPSIFVSAWHVYLVFPVSLVQYCAYAYKMMKVQKLEPEGSCTYSTSSLKLCQGGPHLQSNLTTKVKYSTTSNQILEMPALRFAHRGNSRGLHLVSCVCASDMAYLQTKHCTGAMSWLFWQGKSPNLHERESWSYTGACLWPRCQQSGRKTM